MGPSKHVWPLFAKTMFGSVWALSMSLCQLPNLDSQDDDVCELQNSQNVIVSGSNQKLWHFYNSAIRKYALPGPAPEMQINACNQRVARFPMKHTRGALLTYAHTDVWEKWYRRTCNHTDRYTDRWEKWYRRTDCWWIKVIKLKPLNSQRSVRLYNFS